VRVAPILHLQQRALVTALALPEQRQRRCSHRRRSRTYRRENILDVRSRAWFIKACDCVCRKPAFCHPSFIRQRFRRQVTGVREVRRFGRGGLIVGGPLPEQSRQFQRDVVVVSKDRVNPPDAFRFGAIARRPATGENHPWSSRRHARRVGWMLAFDRMCRFDGDGLRDGYAFARGLQHRQPRRPPGGLAALAGGFGRHAAGVNHPQVGARGFDLDEPGSAKYRGDLLALVVVDATAERMDRKRPHHEDKLAPRGRGSEDRESPAAIAATKRYARGAISAGELPPAL